MTKQQRADLLEEQKAAIEAALQESKYHYDNAAKLLKITRTTLYARMRRCKIPMKHKIAH